MATHDRSHGGAQLQSGADARTARPLRLDWSAVFGGSLIGWGALLLASLIGMILGLSVIDPFAARPALSNAGAGIWGAASAVVSAFIGAFVVVKLAGDRRRGASLMHGAVAWGLSMLLAGLIALFAAGAAAFTRTPVGNNPAGRKSARSQTAALVETNGEGPLVAIFATGGALLALVGSLLGALAAASRESGIPFSNEFRLGRAGKSAHSGALTSTDVRRDETTILPPTH
jgi:hypothetical protein